MDFQEKVEPNILRPKELSRVILFTLLFYFLAMIFAAVMLMLGWKKLALIAEAFFIIPAIFYVISKKYSFIKAFRLTAVNAKILIFSFLIAFCLIILGDELDRLIGSIFPLPAWFDAKQLMEIHSIVDGILIIGTAVVVAALVEEMLFRGMIQLTLESVNETARAILFSAIFFALLHLNPWWMIQITFLGLILGYLAWKSNSILPTIIIHATNNLFAILTLNCSETSLKWYATENHVQWYWLVLAGILIIPGIKGFQRECDLFMAKNSTITTFNEGGSGE